MNPPDHSHPENEAALQSLQADVKRLETLVVAYRQAQQTYERMMLEQILPFLHGVTQLIGSLQTATSGQKVISDETQKLLLRVDELETELKLLTSKN